MKKQIGLIGLGKMGAGLALNLHDHEWDVTVYNRTASKTDEIVKEGLKGSYSIKELVESLEKPRIVWIMLTAGDPTQNAIFGEEGLVNYLEEGDIIIEGGNSKYYEDQANAEKLRSKGIKYIDAGVSGGPYGARNGACIMIGGEKEIFEYLEPIFKDLSLDGAYKFFAGYGAGHFIKMVHNGIEYGMMQAIAEGFNLINESEYKPDLVDVADIYNKGSVIQSRLIQWTKDGFIKYGKDLKDVSGSVGANGEGLWTVETAKKMNIDVPVIEESVKFRDNSQRNPSFTGKILSMIRNMFGGHSIEVGKNT